MSEAVEVLACHHRLSGLESLFSVLVPVPLLQLMALTDSSGSDRVQIITPSAALTRNGQKQLVREVTEIVANISGDPTRAGRTRVILN